MKLTTPHFTPIPRQRHTPLSRQIFAAMLAAFATLAQAADYREYPDLPPQQSVLTALQNAPGVVAARAGMQAGQAAGDRIAAGPHEINLLAGTSRRRVTDPAENLKDWTVGLESALRLPNKYRIDQQLAEQTSTAAEQFYGDAMHETARQLLAGWFGWLKESAQAEQWRLQTEIMQKQSETVKRRVKAGDAAALEADLAEAARMQAEIAWQQARLRADNAASQLRTYFPALPLPANPGQPDPIAVNQPLQHWLDQGLDHNHELMLARTEVKTAQLMSQRMDADLLPDPTVGVHYTSERNGADKITGVTIAIPLPGSARRAASSEYQARAQMTAQKEATVIRRLQSEITAAYNTAQTAHASWQNARRASELMQHNTERMGRAYELGEIGLSEVLLARKQNMETRLSELLARLDAAESRYRLLLDTHQLWPLGADEHDHEK